MATSLVNTNVAQTRFYQGYGTITMVQYRGWETYHSIQISLTRRLRNGVSVGFNDTVGLYDWTNVTARLQHNADGTVTVRSDQAQAQALLGNQYPTRHQMKANFIWVLPKLRAANAGAQGGRRRRQRLAALGDLERHHEHAVHRRASAIRAAAATST